MKSTTAIQQHFIFPLFFIFFALLFLPSCKTTGGASSGKVKKRSANYLLKQVDQHHIDVEWFDAKAKVAIEFNGQGISALSTIRIQKDKAIWMNAKKLGFEAGRMLITPDSIYVINRINREYYAKDFSYAQERMGLPADQANFQTIQAILLGNPVFFGNELETNVVDLQYHLSGVTGEIENDYWLDGFTYLLKEMAFVDGSQGRMMSMTLDKYEPLDKYKNFSYFRTLELNSEEMGMANIKIDFSKIEINVPKSIPFDIPSKYKKVD